MIFVILSIFFQETIPLSKANFEFTIELSGKINNSEERPFYQHTKSYFYKDSYYIFDNGNLKIYKLDKSFEDEKVISFQGNGPGENTISPSTVFFAENKLFLGYSNKISVYDLNLNHVKDISLIRTMKIGASFRFNDKIIIKHINGLKHAFTYLDFEGNVIFEKENPNYKESGPRGGITNFSLAYLEFGKNILTFNEGDYRIDLYDEKLNKLKSFKRNFDRVENPNYERQLEKAKQKRAFAKSKGGSHFSYVSEYFSDISYAIGYYKSYLLLVTESEDTNVLSIDLINLDTNEYDQIELNYNWKYNFIWHMNISENKIFIDYANDDDGPGIFIYEISKAN